MNNNFNLDDFEDFLSDSAEEHRMYPSDKVWRNIDQELHGNRRWPALTFGAILTGALITAGLILIHPDKTLFNVEVSASGTNKSTIVSPDLANTASSEPAISSGAKIINFPKRNRPAFTGSIVNAVTDADISQAKELNLGTSPFPETQHVSTDLNIPNEQLSGSGVKAELAKDLSLQDIVTDESGNSNSAVSREVLSIAGSTTGNDVVALPEAPTNVTNRNPSVVAEMAAVSNSITAPLPSLISKHSRLSYEIYATPSITYRFLSEAKVVDLHQQAGPLAPNFTHGVNNFARHKPIAGLEIGGGIIFNLTHSVRLRAGLQANVRGYSIEAYASKREPSTIVLNRGYYIDSLVTISTISNQNGYKQMNITNRYFELSIPVAMDMRVANWKKVQLYVAAGLQPTYQFNQSMYMISADYKNYVQEPGLVRHFNMNSTLEAFMSYKAAGVTWQVGPQIRYQLLPGATNQYPVRERLIDYGFKIGVVKTLK